jgi:pilus assembly protein CpaF
VLSNFIPPTDRIVTIEDAAELLLNQDHVVSLEARPANIEGKGAISIRDLVKNALRMRPDRIVVGECRGGEALDMLQAMNTGHDGSLTTLHANTARDALARLETLVLMAGFDLPIRAIRVEIARMRDGTRKLTSITEVVGMEGDIITLQEIVNFHPTGLDEAGKVTGNFAFTGVQPRYMERFEENGVDFDMRELSKLRPAEAVW